MTFIATVSGTLADSGSGRPFAGIVRHPARHRPLGLVPFERFISLLTRRLV
jgi:hypothetical protein